MKKIMVYLMITAITNWGVTQLIAENAGKPAPNKGAQQGAGKGDNNDDRHSGKIDRAGDGNSGQGDDKKEYREKRAPKDKQAPARAREEALKKYDKDGDGKLNDAEKAQMKADREARRTEKSNESGQDDNDNRGGQGPGGVIHKYDKDGDNELNMEELIKFRAGYAARRAEFAALKKWDKDGDGKLNDAEKAQMKADREAAQKAQRAAMLKKYDKDGDGKLNDAEKAQCKADQAAARTEAMTKFIKKWDKDGDGKLNAGELAHYMRTVHELRDSERGPTFSTGKEGKPDNDGNNKPKAGGRADEKSRRAEIIKKYDKDGDGKLNDAEKNQMNADREAKQKAQRDKDVKRLNNGVRDQGKGEGRDDQGQGKGQGKKPGSGD